MSRTTAALISALVRRAARAAPSSLAARLKEEWLADMHARSSSRARLCFAVGCYWASLAIGLEHRPLRVPMANTVAGNAGVFIEPPRFFSSRAVTLGLVLSLHAVIFGGLMMARTQLFKPAEPPAIQPRVIDQPRSLIKPSPPVIGPILIDKLPPLPDLPPEVLSREVPPVVSGPEAVIASTAGTTAATPPHEVVHVPGGAGSGFPHPDDYYPDAARRLEEQGAAVIQVCVDTVGRLTADPIRAEPSGSARLDAAAIRLAKAGSGHYRPATEDGRPVASCYPIKIRFQLRN